MSALPSRGPDLAEVLLLEQQAEVVQPVVQHVVVDAHAHVQGTQGQEGRLESDRQRLQATVGLPIHNRHLPTPADERERGAEQSVSLCGEEL